MPHRVTEMDFDEVSTVDVPANQHGLIVLAKRASQEETVDYYDAEGNPIDGDPREVLEVGDYFQDADGQPYQLTADDDESEYDGVAERELESVGKSAFFDTIAKGGDDFFAAVQSELRKAATDEAREEVLAKALTAQRTELAKAQQKADEAYAIAKAAQDREEIAKYVELAKNYNVPVAPEDLGPVLQRMSKAMSYDDCAVIAGLLETSGDIFKSYGLDGEADTDDPFEAVEQYIQENAPAAASEMAKRAPIDGGRSQLSKEGATTAFFDSHPSEYSALKRSRRNG